MRIQRKHQEDAGREARVSERVPEVGHFSEQADQRRNPVGRRARRHAGKPPLTQISAILKAFSVKMNEKLNSNFNNLVNMQKVASIEE